MLPTPRSLLLVAVDDAVAAACALGGWAVSRADAVGDAAQHQAVLLGAPGRQALAGLLLLPGLPAAARSSAVVVMTGIDEAGIDDEGLEAELLRLGVEAIVPAGDPPAVLRALRHAVERKAVERSTRLAYATDLVTGLPHRAQLVEHMSHLLALYPEHGKDAETLLRHAGAQAGSVATLGRDGLAARTERGPGAAANDDAS